MKEEILTASNGQPINVRIENYTGSEPIKIIYREDNPREELKTIQAKLPEALNITGIISAPADWLEKRSPLFDHDNARVEVKREDSTIKLIINERNCAPGLDAYIPDEAESYNGDITCRFRERSTVTGSIQFTDLFLRLAINKEDSWIDPQKLAAFFRLNRSIFPDLEENMRIVSILKNIKAKINADYEKTKDTYSGSRTEFYQMSVEHNLPKSFDISIAIFKGAQPEKYNIEFDVDIVDGKILLQLKSPAINDEVTTARDIIINAELDRIRTIAPDLVIIEQ